MSKETQEALESLEAAKSLTDTQKLLIKLEMMKRRKKTGIMLLLWFFLGGSGHIGSTLAIL